MTTSGQLRSFHEPSGKAAKSIFVVVPAEPGCGGLGHSASVAITALGSVGSVHALGGGQDSGIRFANKACDVSWTDAPTSLHPWLHRYTWLRWYSGAYVLIERERLGRWAAQQLPQVQPDACYIFTEVALESLRWARSAGRQGVLYNPNGHIRTFHEICEREAQQWTGGSFRGHPTSAMVERVEEEYRLAARIRVNSEWARRSMVARGVDAARIWSLLEPVDTSRFQPREMSLKAEGPLRVCYAGALSLRKGFPYLLRAIRTLGAANVELRIVGATGDHQCARLFDRERKGLNVTSKPGDPLPTYRWADVFVLPSLEDGFGLVAAEAMACGVPVIVTDQCGAAECVQPGQNGWIVRSGDVEGLATALDSALTRRSELYEMGRRARASIEELAGPAQVLRLARWFSTGLA